MTPGGARAPRPAATRGSTVGRADAVAQVPHGPRTGFAYISRRSRVTSVKPMTSACSVASLLLPVRRALAAR